jgi:hypothetical protein
LQTSADEPYERTNGMSMMAPPRHALVEKDEKVCKGLRSFGRKGGLLGDEIDSMVFGIRSEMIEFHRNGPKLNRIVLKIWLKLNFYISPRTPLCIKTINKL